MPPLCVARSVDSGFTWSLPQETGLHGDFPALLTLPDGRFLLTCTQRRPDASSVLAFLSEDGGTWGDPLTLHEAPGHLFHYPSTALLPTGRLLTVWMSASSDLIRVVEAVHWDL